MMIPGKIERDVATLLWVAAGVLVGLIVAWQLGSSARQLLFFIVLGGGVVLLARVHIRVERQGFTVKALPAPSRKILPERSTAGESRVSLLTGSDEPLSPEQARQALDGFLMQQQQTADE